jgi:superfamily I DNA and RNA helicase
LALADCYRDKSRLEASNEAIRRAIDDEAIRMVACPSVSSIPDKIANEIGKFRSAGFKPSDIAIVSVRGQQGGGTFGLERIGAYRLVKADDPSAEDEIVDDTFLRFKGLERPAVIVTDLHLIKEPRNVRMYIALTRALTAVRIVAPQKSFPNDPILKHLIKEA